MGIEQDTLIKVNRVWFSYGEDGAAGSSGAADNGSGAADSGCSPAGSGGSPVDNGSSGADPIDPASMGTGELQVGNHGAGAAGNGGSPAGNCPVDNGSGAGTIGAADGVSGHGQRGEERGYAIEDVAMSVKKGEFVAIIGANGSGKSTLARLLNALLIPRKGTVLIKGKSTLEEEYIWEVRRTVGMVFQNPDNQIVGTTVEEDVAFGVENLGVESAQIRVRIDDAMNATGVFDLSDKPPYQLSGGQKQRVAIAGILAMKPECIVLDEATAMLDPDGRREVLSIVRELNKTEGISVIMITHHMSEVSLAERVIVLDDGKIALDGTPAQLFSDVELVESMGLEAPEITKLFYLLGKRGIDLPKGITQIDEAYNIIVEKLEAARACPSS